MEEEVMIKYKSGNEDDEIEALFKLWKENLQYFDERDLRQHAETLVSDIMKFVFDFSSNSQKYANYAKLFIEVVKSKVKSDDAIKSVDVYWIQKQLFSNLMLDDDIGSYEKYFYELILDTSTKSADENISCDNMRAVDAGLIGDVLTQEYLAARYVMSNLQTSKNVLNFVMSDAKCKNIRNFIDSILKHEDIPLDTDNLVEIFKNSVMNMHNCILENQIFLLDFLLSNVISKLDNATLREVLNSKNSKESNIFHLACEKRIKFLIEELWIFIQKAYESDDSQIEKYLLSKNGDDKNVFMIAFQMPLIYTNSDYANEIKSRSNLLNYYRNPGPLELEMYNFESSLNLLYDIGRKNISVKCKKGLILSNKPKAEKCYDTYDYSENFKGFRHEFLQLRFYCITKISSINTGNSDLVNRIYHFLSRYIDYFIYQHCNNEQVIVDLYQKLSFDTFLVDFFKAMVQNNFILAFSKMTTAENSDKLISIVKKVLPPNDYHKVLSKSGANGNNVLQMAINTRNSETFRVVWSSFDYGHKAIANWILERNNDKNNSLYSVICSHQIEILQSMLNYFSANLEEEQIMYILENTHKNNYKFMDIAVLFYDQKIFDLLIDFIQTHLSAGSQKALIGDSIVLLAVSKWQESAVNKVLSLIEGLMNDNEIKEILFYTNWEGQTAFHIGSKNRNLKQLQQLCKFAHYYLDKDTFVELIKTKDKSEYSIVKNEQMSDDLVYNELPIISNFYSTYPAYEWIPLIDLQFPQNAFIIGNDNDSNVMFIARVYQNNEDNSEQLEIKALSKNSELDFDTQYIDILVGRGLAWYSKNIENISPIKIENNGTYYIAKFSAEIKLIDVHSNLECDILCTTDEKVLEIDDHEDYIFTRVN